MNKVTNLIKDVRNGSGGYPSDRKLDKRPYKSILNAFKLTSPGGHTLYNESLHKVAQGLFYFASDLNNQIIKLDDVIYD